MELVTRIKTLDGKTHDNKKDALRHLDRLYGDILLRIARDLGELNYTGRSDYIDQNLDLFVRLSKIKADMQIEEPEEEGQE
jgi:hypothetical protein